MAKDEYSVKYYPKDKSFYLVKFVETGQSKNKDGRTVHHRKAVDIFDNRSESLKKEVYADPLIGDEYIANELTFALPSGYQNPLRILIKFVLNKHPRLMGEEGV